MNLLDFLLIALFLLSVLQVFLFIKKYKALSLKNLWLTELNGLIDGGNYVEGEHLGISLLKSNPEDFDLHYSLGYCAYKLNRTEEALRHFDKAVSFKNAAGTAWHSLGYIWYYDKKNPEKAIKFLKQAIKRAPSFFRAYNTLAIVLDSTGKTAEALTLLKKSVKKYGGDANSLNTLGLLAFKQKDFLHAEEYFKSSIELCPSAETFSNLGNLYSLQLEFADAVFAFKKAEELDERDKQIKYWLGSALYLNHELKEAETKLNEAIGLDQNFAKAYLQRAFVNKKLKNNDAFLADYNKAITLDPSLKEKGAKDE
ncbi:MAG: hypothetical protein A2231_13130 [Candidatus Firestonebacteria bacterium RIFOXYA2_FULL_40_8]|nr:MAG: hypothetical protein A2231_13130 [Candidatus Firestonebacteria bacterium RIFOXYA2_FULL_40_8]